MTRSVPIALVGLLIYALSAIVPMVLLFVLFAMSGTSPDAPQIVARVLAVIMALLTAFFVFLRVGLWSLLWYARGSHSKAAVYSYFVSNGFFPKNDRLVRAIATRSECVALDELKRSEDEQPSDVFTSMRTVYHSRSFMSSWFPMLWLALSACFSVVGYEHGDVLVCVLFAVLAIMFAYRLFASLRQPATELRLDAKGFHYDGNAYEWSAVLNISATAQQYTNTYSVMIEFSNNSMEIDCFRLGADSFQLAWQMNMFRQKTRQ